MTSSKPYQYIKGWVEFYKLRFRVTPDVLIPRPETELLVDEVLESIKYLVLSIKWKDIVVFDVGTGAGNIAISVAKNAPAVKIIATDISESALNIAKSNAKLHGVTDRISFIQSNLLSAFCHSEAKPKNISTRLYPSLITQDDNLIIVTNLPYIPSARIPYLDHSVKDFEPSVALDGGEDGFELYRKLFQQIKQLSTPGVDSNLHSRSVAWKPKLIICEIDYTHEELARNEAQKYFPEAEIEIKTDMAQKQRILLIRQIL